MVLNYTVTDQSLNQTESNEPNSMQLQIPAKALDYHLKKLAINSDRYLPLSSPIALLGVFVSVGELSPQ
jgi:hypothetical protein